MTDVSIDMKGYDNTNKRTEPPAKIDKVLLKKEKKLYILGGF